MIHRNLAALGLAFALACGGATLSQDKVTNAEAAARAAEVGGATGEPEAALYLKYARDQIVRARAHAQNDELEQAHALLDKAVADAELALKIAKRESAKREVQAALEELAQLREQYRLPQ